MSQPAALPPDLVVACSLLFGTSRDLDMLDLRTLKRTYRRRALETHPDRARATGADAALLTRRFQELTAAYESLRVYLGRTRARRVAGSPRSPSAQRASTPPRATTPPRASAPPRAPASSRASTPPGSATPPRSTARPAASPRGKPPAGAGSATAPRPSATAGTASAPAAGSGRTVPPPRGGARAGVPGGAATSSAGDHYWGGRLPDRDLLLGQYLYYSGRISWRALIGAIHWQRTQRPHLGQLAVRAGYLAPERVRELMAVKPFDERFGEAAVRLGYLRPESRDALVAQQRSLQRRLGIYFVEMGILPADEVQRAAVRQLQHNWSRPRDPGPGRL